MKDLSKHYSTLTPHERFQLMIKAMARGDEADVERLNQTCPRHTYQMTDLAYMDRHYALLRLMAAFMTCMQETRGKLTMHGITQDLLAHLMNWVDDAVHFAYYRGLSDAGGKGQPSKAANDLTEKQIEDIRAFADRMTAAVRQGVLTRAKADFEAFEIVCRERLGLDVETVLAGLGGAEVLAWLDRRELQQAEPLEAPELQEMFVSCWDREVKAAG